MTITLTFEQAGAITVEAQRSVGKRCRRHHRKDDAAVHAAGNARRAGCRARFAGCPPMSGGDLEFARELARASAVASLATLDPDGGPPHASFVTVALDRDLSPLLLLSGLARHRRNLEANPAAALLMTGEGRKVEAAADPLAGDRVTLRGTIAITDEPEDRSRFLSRHPAAVDYAGFADFDFLPHGGRRRASGRRLRAHLFLRRRGVAARPCRKRDPLQRRGKPRSSPI